MVNLFDERYLDDMSNMRFISDNTFYNIWKPEIYVINYDEAIKRNYVIA